MLGSSTHFCNPGKKQEVLAKGGNILVEPGTSGLKFLVIPRNGYLTGYQEDENSPNRVPNREAFFLVGSWLKPEDFGFGHPLAETDPKLFLDPKFFLDTKSQF